VLGLASNPVITAGLALGVVVGLLGGIIAVLGAGVAQLPQRRLGGIAATAGLAGRRVALAGLIVFAVTWVVWMMMIALAKIFDL
jgi:hypothetical protein